MRVAGSARPAWAGPGAFPYWALFAGALALRLLFVVTQPQIPPWGDIPSYAGIALGMGHFVLYGEAHPVTAQLFFSRGPFLPSLYAAAFAAYFRHDFSLLSSFETVLTRFDWNIFRLGQAVIDACTCAGVALIGTHLADRRSGLIAGALAAVYPPFILWVGQPLREVWVAFGLTAAALLTLAALQRPGRRWPLGSGLAWGVTSQMLPGPIGLGLLLPWLAGLAYHFWRERKPILPALLRLWPSFAAFLAIWLLRWGLMLLILGRVSEAVVGVGATGGFWNHLGTSGWPPDGYSAPAVAPGVRQGSGTVLEVAANGLRSFAATPGVWLGVFGQNVLRLWLYPYNTFVQPFLLDWAGQVVFHRLLLALVLFATPLVIARAPRAALAALPPLYFTFVFGAESVETRFVAMGLPLLLPAAGFGLALVWDVLRALDRRAQTRLGLLLAGAGLLALARLPQVLAVWPALAPGAAQFARLALGAALAAGALLWLGRRAAGAVGRGAAVAGLAIGFPVLLAAAWYAAFGSSEWHTWSAPATGPLSVIHARPEQFEQTILLPPGGLRGGQVVLLADFETNDGAAVAISVNGELVKPPGRALSIRPDMYESFYDVWLQFTGMALAEVRRWWELPLPGPLLADAGSAVIRVWIDPAYPYAWLRMYGDYPTRAEVFDGPRLPYGARDLSLYRFRWDMRREPRLDGRAALNSTATTARRFDGLAWRADDLSADRGRQTGTYRLRLAHLPDIQAAGAAAEALRAARVIVY